jgi:hypothetical protein
MPRQQVNNFLALKQNAGIHNHNTCQKLNLHVHFCRTDAFKKGVINMGTNYTINYQI